MRRYGYNPDSNEVRCPNCNCMWMFVMDPACIVYSGTCDDCSTLFSARRQLDGSITIRTLLEEDAFATPTTGWEIDIAEAYLLTADNSGIEIPISIDRWFEVGQSWCVTPEPVYNPEPYKRGFDVDKLLKFWESQ